MSRGLFISFEGTDGSGKTTQYRLFAEYLVSLGYEVVTTREPGGTPISEKIRGIILDPENTEMDDMTEALLFAAGRAQHVAQLIRPSVEAGKIVLCDRFMDSSIAYQGYARGLGDCVRIINEYAVAGMQPDLTFLLDLPPQAGRSRNVKAGKADRLEKQAMEFHSKVYEGYKKLAEIYPDRFIVIDADGSIEEVQARIRREFFERKATRSE
ncbi:MAG: dTMP kinase [Firmicutes bacterium]|nr:dTMP kinase [Bacillota bacterium]